MKVYKAVRLSAAQTHKLIGRWKIEREVRCERCNIKGYCGKLSESDIIALCSCCLEWLREQGYIVKPKQEETSD